MVRRRERKSSKKDGVLRCACFKTGYKSEGEALEILGIFSAQENNRRKRPQRVYQCDLSGWWHLTSQDLLE